ncbi:troponin C, isotype gamma [Hyalella azteca]|uniref:Troponin C, isotype gamma n=1 Tax=Hyalella azteca TaxID=294128 RepID=A0A8B7PRP4_HYAAZ|nr:troponin C, isotype gamma [Hyalella azteca]
MASDLDEQTLHALRKAFALADPGKSGHIDVSVVRTSLASAGVSAEEEDLQAALSQVDLTDGRVTWDTYVLLAASFLDEDDEETIVAELKEAFRMYDKEGRGYITTKVLREILKELDNKITEKDMDEIIDDVDEEGNGRIDFTNFKHLML